jgi:muramoyltetrapeptide carboxypeptidase
MYRLGMKGSVSPRRAIAGDLVAIVSPSWGAVGAWPHRAEKGIQYLESLGLRVKLMPNAARSEEWVSAAAEARADDINAAFKDDEVRIILSSIGGDHSNQVVPYLDFEVIRSHPKIFQGYSDITVLCWALLKHARLRTFYGPALTLSLAEYPRVLAYTDHWLRAAWFGDQPLRYEPSSEWTEEFLDFNTKQDLTRPRRLTPSPGWCVIRSGTTQGWLLAGCFETVCWHVKGSDSWIDPEGAILMLETSEIAISPAAVDAYMTDLELMGVFEKISGLIFGRPYGYDPKDVEILWKVLEKRTESSMIPVLGGFDFGHTDPLVTLPLGAPMRLDTHGPRVEVIEPPTR